MQMYILCIIVLIFFILRWMGSETAIMLWPVAKFLLGILTLIFLLVLFFSNWMLAVVVLVTLMAVVNRNNS